MDLAASYTFAAPPSTVWSLLMDHEVIASCLPGCDRLDPMGEDRYRAELRVSVAAITGRYTGSMAVLDKRPPSACRLVVEGSGAPGFVKGEAQVELLEQDRVTIVHVRGQAQVGGLMARVGQRLLGSVAKMMMDRFFTCLQQRVGTGQEPPTSGAADEPADD